jgi:hypothetical protein
MPAQKVDLSPVKRGAAVLTACVVRTLNESDPSFQKRFLALLERAHRQLREIPQIEGSDESEMLAWTREILTGFNFSEG